MLGRNVAGGSTTNSGRWCAVAWLRGGLTIAVQHIESILHISEAHVKMHLREYVRDDDVDAMVEVSTCYAGLEMLQTCTALNL